MKKMIYLAGLILLISVIFSGCAGKQPQKQDADQGDAKIGAPYEQQTVSQGGSENVKVNVSSVDQAELDKLKADLEKLEAEDLGGLSGN